MTEPTKGAVAALSRYRGASHVVTIGNFDGVHRGHRYLIEGVRDRAKAAGVRSLVVTFEPHPTSVLRPDVPFERLTTPADKLQLIEATGVDDIAVIPFDREFASLLPDEFLSLLSDTVTPVAVHVGEGFRFGRDRSGDGAAIAAFGARAGFDTVVMPRLRDDDRVISSSSIREALHRGQLETAGHWLGRRYRLRGTVEHGVARGRELGYPTANLRLAAHACVPRDGIYAGYAHVDVADSPPRQAMIYIGSRPTFDNGDRLVEVNILDFSGDLYTLDIELEFVEFVREDMAFDSVDALVARIGEDETVTRSALGHQPPENC